MVKHPQWWFPNRETSSMGPGTSTIRWMMEANSVSCALIITKTLTPTPYMLCDNKQVENGGGCPFLRTPRGF